MNMMAGFSIRSLKWIGSVTALVSLAACYVVPVDPRTGQPYPPASQTGQAAMATAQAQHALAASNYVILQAKLYPVNDEASMAGPLVATATDSDNGRGTFNVTYKGERLQGDATRVDANQSGFGRIYREVLGTSASIGSGGRRGIANGVSPNGSSVQCEYHMTSKDVGTGVCLFSSGAKYQMHFGA